MKKYRSFTEARKFVHRLGLKSREEWQEYCKSGKKPDDIPSWPRGVYKKEWKGWGDWLGTGFIAYPNRKYKTFNKSRKFARLLKLKSIAEWTKYCKSGKKPDDIPVAPNSAYKKEWKGWGDFLGTGNLSGSEKHKRYKSFEKARDFVRKLLLKNQKEWNAYLMSGKKPDYIPNTPRSAYEKEWKGIGDFLGYRQYHRGSARSFVKARMFARLLKLKWRYEWEEYCKTGKKPDDIPNNVSQTYKKEWKDWGDFLGTGWIAPGKRKYRSFKEARKFAHKLKLKNMQEWIEYYSSHGPKDIPIAPWNIYKKEWKGWGDFLGTGFVATQKRIYLSAKEARIVIRKIAKEVFGGKPFSEQDWVNAHKAGKIPASLPRYLGNVYDPDYRKGKKK